MTSPDATSLSTESDVWKGILVNMGDANGVVTSVNDDGRCSVQRGTWDSSEAQFHRGQDEEVAVEVSQLKAVVPRKNDRVRVLRGPRMASVGLASIVDCDNGMVFAKVGHDLDLTVHDIGHVGVMVGDV